METQNADKIQSMILTIIAVIIIMYIILPDALELNSIVKKMSAEIITAGNNLYAVWADNTTGNGDIYFKRISDNGNNFNFSSTYNLSNDKNGTSFDPQIIT